MKISSVTIPDYHQFRDFTLDLTYPAGHPKAGKPLDKVCLIGQSGTGKTSLLEWIFAGTKAVSEKLPVPEEELGRVEIILVANENHCHNTLIFCDGGKAVAPTVSIAQRYVVEGQVSPSLDLVDDESGYRQSVYYFPVILLTDFRHLDTQIKRLSRKRQIQKVEADSDSQTRTHFQFDDKTSAIIWEQLHEKVKKYQVLEANFRIKLTRDAEREPETDIDIAARMQEWRLSHPNPTKDIADSCLDKMLNKFQLRTKTDVENVEGLNTIQIESLDGGTVIPYETLSTGTRQIIFTALPLYAYEPENAIILIDEPETSLFPDVQREVVDYYSSFGKNNQLFFATHSPIVAASFDPWEIIELEFDSTGKVRQNQHFRGARSIDNYHIHPKYLTWSAILQKFFDVAEEGNQERIEKLMELSQLDGKLKKMKAEGATAAEIQPVWKEYKAVADLLDWDIS